MQGDLRMARPNVTVVIDDQSFVVPNTEGGSLTRAGLPSVYGLVLALGNTAERKSGTMTIVSPMDWVKRLTTDEQTAGDGWTDNPDHRSHSGGSGTTGPRWPYGPTAEWKNEWWAVHNYLQYGGVCVVGATGTQENTSDGYTTLKDKQIPLDLVFAATGGSGYITSVSNIASVRQDCVAVLPAIQDSGGSNEGHVALSSGDAAISGSQDEYNITVFGNKKHLDITRGINDADNEANYIRTCLAPDVAGCIARTDRDAYPWFSPAGFKRGRILDVVRLEENPNEGMQDIMYDANINPVVTFPGEGTVLFGDKTGKDESSTLSRINVSRLFIHLKKTIGAAARAILFELNDVTTRASFVNAVTPMLDNIQARRGLYDFRVVCDRTNNTDALIDANQFVADIYLKPTKSINFIKVTFTNKNTADDLGVG